MLAWIKGVVSGWVIRFALYIVDKAIAGALDGVMDDKAKNTIGNRVDHIVDKIQASGSATGKSVRKNICDVCDVIKAKLKEANGIN